MPVQVGTVGYKMVDQRWNRHGDRRVMCSGDRYQWIKRKTISDRSEFHFARAVLACWLAAAVNEVVMVPLQGLVVQ